MPAPSLPRMFVNFGPTEDGQSLKEVGYDLVLPRISKLLHMHQKIKGGTLCKECLKPFPCPTYNTLQGDLS